MIVGVWYRSPDIFPACFVCVPTKRVFAFLSRVCRTDSGFSAPTETGKAVSQHPDQHGCRGRAQGECMGQESPRELRRPSVCAERSSRWMTHMRSRVGWMDHASCLSTELCSALASESRWLLPL